MRVRQPFSQPVVCLATTDAAGGFADDVDPSGAYGLLRHVVATHVGAHPVRLYPPQRGKHPAWARVEGGQVVWTSVSRTGGVIAVGCGPTRMGVDVEERQTLSQAGDLVRVFHPRDRAGWSGLSVSELPIHVTAGWVRKEAMVKAQATGLSQDPALQPVGTVRQPQAPRGWVTTSVAVKTHQGGGLLAVSPLANATHMVGLAWWGGLARALVRGGARVLVTVFGGGRIVRIT